MLRTSVLPCIFAVFLMIGLSGCQKKSGEAVVVAKEHIDARLPDAETPSTMVGQESARTTGTQTEAEAAPNVQIRQMTDDEIAVDGHVMKREVRGTGRDPRALKDEQWIVKVRMLDNGRTFQVPADQAQWEKLRENDRVRVKYRTGKYTGTVWAAEIE